MICTIIIIIIIIINFLYSQVSLLLIFQISLVN